MDKLFDEKLLALQKTELEILCVLRDFCNSKSITYYLAFGTLLGAVRHQGFIPWDDDIDVFMPRNSFQRFLQEAEKDLPSWLTIRLYKNTHKEEEKIPLQAKIESKNHYVVRQRGARNVKHRVWVDIFLLDGMPPSYIGRLSHYAKIYAQFTESKVINKALYALEKRRSSFVGKKAILSDKLHEKELLNVKKVFRNIDSALAKYDYDSSDYVIGYAAAYGMNCIVPKRCFGEGQPILFEGEIFNAPADPDTLLKSWYGDYMTLPPEEQRIAKHCVDIIMDDSDETSA